MMDGVDPTPLPDDSAPLFTQYVPDLQTLKKASTPYTAIILATKPTHIHDVCQALSNRPDMMGPDTLVLSIAAGRTVTSIASALPPRTPIIRAMPNLPASIGCGVTALFAPATTPAPIRDIAQTLCATVGDVVWINDEGLMDAVTALSGSGPAYVFLLIEEMARAGVALGLPVDTAMRLSRQTVIGAANLAATSPDITAETLRQNVTSPGGTTAAALDILMNGKDHTMADLFAHALTAARDRSRELSQ
jgi:pyrroline-5-carboxylate reductase